MSEQVADQTLRAVTSGSVNAAATLGSVVTPSLVSLRFHPNRWAVSGAGF